MTLDSSFFLPVIPFILVLMSKPTEEGFQFFVTLNDIQ
jgi:hypothetical protein